MRRQKFVDLSFVGLRFQPVKKTFDPLHSCLEGVGGYVQDGAGESKIESHTE